MELIPGVPAHSCSNSPADMTIGSTLQQHEACKRQQDFCAVYRRLPTREYTTEQIRQMLSRKASAMCLIFKAYSSFLKASSVWKDLPWPFPPHIPRMSGILKEASKQPASTRKFFTMCSCKSIMNIHI